MVFQHSGAQGTGRLENELNVTFVVGCPGPDRTLRRMYVVAPRFDTRILIVTCPPVGLQCAWFARASQVSVVCRVSRARTASDPIHAMPMAPVGMGMAEHLEGFRRQRGCSAVP